MPRARWRISSLRRGSKDSRRPSERRKIGRMAVASKAAARTHIFLLATNREPQKEDCPKVPRHAMIQKWSHRDHHPSGGAAPVPHTPGIDRAIPLPAALASAGWRFRPAMLEAVGGFSPLSLKAGTFAIPYAPSGADGPVSPVPVAPGLNSRVRKEISSPRTARRLHALASVCALSAQRLPGLCTCPENAMRSVSVRRRCSHHPGRWRTK